MIIATVPHNATFQRHVDAHSLACSTHAAPATDLAATAEPVFKRGFEADERRPQVGRTALPWPESLRDEILGRLLDLNARRHAEEQLAATISLTDVGR